VVIALAVVLLAALLFFELRGQRPLRLIAKAALSTLFVVTAATRALSPAGATGFAWTIVTAMVLCLVGDVCLALPLTRDARSGADPEDEEESRSSFPWFLAGLAAFLLGHVGYIVAFFSAGRVNALTGLGALVTTVVSATVFRWLSPRLGRMRLPVLAYMTVLTLMVVGAWTVAGTTEIPPLGRGFVIWGALLFFVSDLFVARQRFVSPGRVNAVIGLPLYYAGQFLLAFSPAFLP
jgi:uncharacterized membrane protein YhhN